MKNTKDVNYKCKIKSNNFFNKKYIGTIKSTPSNNKMEKNGKILVIVMEMAILNRERKGKNIMSMGKARGFGSRLGIKPF